MVELIETTTQTHIHKKFANTNNLGTFHSVDFPKFSTLEVQFCDCFVSSVQERCCIGACRLSCSCEYISVLFLFLCPPHAHGSIMVTDADTFPQTSTVDPDHICIRDHFLSVITYVSIIYKSRTMVAHSHAVPGGRPDRGHKR